MSNDFEDAVQDAAEWKAKCRELEGEVVKRDARIAELEEQVSRFMASIERKHKLMNEDAAEIDQLRAELAAMREQVPVAVVDCGDDGFFADILPDRSVEVGHKLYAAPVATPKVVMPEREVGHAQKSFWAGFEVARMRPDESNIRAAWNEFIASEQFARLNAADQEGVQDE
jgi:uncharacterized coiled-coil protein SlyX